MNKKTSKSEITNILFCGIGGQGVLKASEIAGDAAMLAGFHAKKSEVHGMSQRGGSVDSHLRFGKVVYSPLISPKAAHFLVPFAAEEGVPMRKFLAKDGVDLTPYLEKAAAVITDKKFLNTYMLGVLAAYVPAIAYEYWVTSLGRIFKRAIDENIAVFRQGFEEASKK
ncbi:MAG: 2-oxoacid:acceptor oxidoreductase family protein [Fibrobacteres bacterium]|nr:2-oxoacid:acceptor oxidoreductase family protein [Fibrobacterota bacterium]